MPMKQLRSIDAIKDEVVNGKTFLAVYTTCVDGKYTGREFRELIGKWPSNNDLISKIKEIGVGSQAVFVKERNPKNPDFWNVVDVEAQNQQSQKQQNVQHKAPANTPMQQPSLTKSGMFRQPDELVRGDAVSFAVQFLSACSRLGKDERFKKMFQVTKTNPDTLFEDMMQRAAIIEKYIKGEINPITEESTQDLEGKAVDHKQPDVPDDEDPPF